MHASTCIYKRTGTHIHTMYASWSDPQSYYCTKHILKKYNLPSWICKDALQKTLACFWCISLQRSTVHKKRHHIWHFTKPYYIWPFWHLRRMVKMEQQLEFFNFFLISHLSRNARHICLFHVKLLNHESKWPKMRFVSCWGPGWVQCQVQWFLEKKFNNWFSAALSTVASALHILPVQYWTRVKKYAVKYTSSHLSKVSPQRYTLLKVRRSCNIVQTNAKVTLYLKGST